MVKNNNEGITLAKNLKYLSKTTSLRKIAKAAGVPQSSLASWVHGQLPSGAAGNRNLRKLCQYLSVSWEQIMYGDVSVKLPETTSLNDFLNGDVFSGRFIVDLKIRKVLPEEK